MSSNEYNEFNFWSQLPLELKSKCVREMSVSQRLNLRATSKYQRTLIDAQKIHVEKIVISDKLCGIFIKVYVKNGETYELHQRTDKTKEPHIVLMLTYFFKNGIIDTLLLFERKDSYEVNRAILSAHSQVFQIDLKKFSIVHARNQKNIDILALCNFVKLERAKIKAHFAVQTDIEEIIQFESLRHIKRWQFHEVYQMDIFSRMAQRWIENDSETGSTLEVTWENETIDEFSAAFRNNVIEAGSCEVRIRTNNPLKHILFMVSTEKSDGDSSDRISFMVVVLASLRKNSSDYKQFMKDNGPEYVIYY